MLLVGLRSICHFSLFPSPYSSDFTGDVRVPWRTGVQYIKSDKAVSLRH